MESSLTQQTITKGTWSLQPLQINKKKTTMTFYKPQKEKEKNMTKGNLT
jgi:hypothetical protein